jgi:hypothetical protein
MQVVQLRVAETRHCNDLDRIAAEREGEQRLVAHLEAAGKFLSHMYL